METIQIRRQYRFIDPDKAKFQANKSKFDWDMSEINEATDEHGHVKENDYEVSCPTTGAKKVMGYRDVELPTTEGEAVQMFQGLKGDARLALVRYAVENREKDALSADLMEQFEPPEKAAKRLEKKQAEVDLEVREYLDKELTAGRWPDKAEALKKVAEIHARHGLPAPGQTE